MHEHEPTALNEGVEQEAQPRDGPRIYVASLSDYVGGILHGRWIDAIEDIDTMSAAIDEVMSSSPTARLEGMPAEEWAIHDYEGFGPLALDEYTSLDTIAMLAAGIAEHGEVFAAWASLDTSVEPTPERFEDVYLGEWSSVEAYAEELLSDVGATDLLEQLPAWLQPYVRLNVEGFACDLQLGGDVTAIATPTHGVWIMRNQ